MGTSVQDTPLDGTIAKGSKEGLDPLGGGVQALADASCVGLHRLTACFFVLFFASFARPGADLVSPYPFECFVFRSRTGSTDA